tara:strand:+ start:3178 stop:3585 length:408 start_codon:yes stop_codon:yes gene_type:complete
MKTLAQLIAMITNNRRLDNDLAFEYVENIFLPSGGGFDGGTTVDGDRTSDIKLVFKTAFHHMNDMGFYTKWTEHAVIITPTFRGVDVRVTGRDHNDIKDYIGDVFHEVMTREMSSAEYCEHMVRLQDVAGVEKVA